jgi:glutamate synthase domain-containing protein 3
MPLQSSRHSTSYDPRHNNRITQTSRDALQSARHLTSYDPRDNNRITQTSRDALQSTRFSTGHDQERQDVNVSTRGARGNNFGGRILNFFARRKKMMYVLFFRTRCMFYFFVLDVCCI